MGNNSGKGGSSLNANKVLELFSQDATFRDPTLLFQWTKTTSDAEVNIGNRQYLECQWKQDLNAVELSSVDEHGPFKTQVSVTASEQELKSMFETVLLANQFHLLQHHSKGMITSGSDAGSTVVLQLDSKHFRKELRFLHFFFTLPLLIVVE